MLGNSRKHWPTGQIFVTLPKDPGSTLRQSEYPAAYLRRLLTQRFLTFRCVPCVKIKHADIVLPVKKGRNSPDGNYSFEFLPVARCPRIEIVKRKVAVKAISHSTISDIPLRPLREDQKHRHHFTR